MASLWNKTNEELVVLADKYKIAIDKADLNRKELVPQLTAAIAKAGDLEAPAGFDEEGNELKIEPEEETCVILFHQREGQTNYVSIGVNGCCLYLPCDVKWRLPIRFKKMLDDTYMIKVVPNVDSTGRTKGVKEFKVPALNYTVFNE